MLGGTDDSTGGSVVGIFKAEQPRAEDEIGTRDTYRRGDLLGRRPSRSAVPRQRLGHAARQPGRRAELAAQHVGLGRRKETIAPLEMQHEPYQVAHRSRRDPQPRLQPEQLCHAGLQPRERRIVVEHVVPHLGFRHRRAHLPRWLRNRVGTEVEGFDSGGHGVPATLVHRARTVINRCATRLLQPRRGRSVSSSARACAATPDSNHLPRGSHWRPKAAQGQIDSEAADGPPVALTTDNYVRSDV